MNIKNIELSSNTINFLRDRALSVEKRNPKVAYELMLLSHHARPEGKFIKRNLKRLEEKLRCINTLNTMVGSGELAIIPIGFRCHTKLELEEKFHIQQPSLPFDSGFFPAESIMSVLNNPTINLDFYLKDSHKVCIKSENAVNKFYGKGVHFKASSYAEINELIESSRVPLN